MKEHIRRLEHIRSKIEVACKKAGRQPDEVSLLAVSKRQTAASIERLNQAGQLHFGENQLQEARNKQQEISSNSMIWHFIGPVQSNKTREISRHFDWVQSIDREKILRRLAEQRPSHLPPLNLCIQVNIDSEPQKAGVMPEAVEALAERANAYDTLKLRGLMCIPRLTDDEKATRQSFERLRDIFATLKQSQPGLDTLSMGMSRDFELAISAGSTMVRIGTDLFGPRPQN